MLRRLLCISSVGIAACLFPDVGDLSRASTDAAPESGAESGTDGGNSGDASDAGNVGDANDAGDASDANVVCGDPTALVGSSNTSGLGTDTTPFPYVDAYATIAGTAAHVACAWFFIATTSAPVVRFGVYRDASHAPDTLLAQAAFENPVSGWNHAPLDTPLDVSANQQVWLGWTVSSGDVELVVQLSGCTGDGFRSDAVTVDAGTLPQTFSVTGSSTTACAPAAYLGH